MVSVARTEQAVWFTNLAMPHFPLPALASVFPDATVVVTHRDPSSVRFAPYTARFL